MLEKRRTEVEILVSLKNKKLINKDRVAKKKKKKTSKFVSLQEEACIESWTMLLRSSSPLVSPTNSEKRESFPVRLNTL